MTYFAPVDSFPVCPFGQQMQSSQRKSNVKPGLDIQSYFMFKPNLKGNTCGAANTVTCSNTFADLKLARCVNMSICKYQEIKAEKYCHRDLYIPSVYV